MGHARHIQAALLTRSKRVELARHRLHRATAVTDMASRMLHLHTVSAYAQYATMDGIWLKPPRHIVIQYHKIHDSLCFSLSLCVDLWPCRGLSAIITQSNSSSV